MLDAHHALREVIDPPVVPFRFKRPLIVNFLYGKISTERLLPVMKAYDTIYFVAAALDRCLAEGKWLRSVGTASGRVNGTDVSLGALQSKRSRLEAGVRV